MTKERMDEFMCCYNREVEQMSRLPIDEWEYKISDAEKAGDKKRQRRAERKLRILENREVYGMGYLAGLEMALSLFGLETELDDEDYCVGIREIDHAANL